MDQAARLMENSISNDCNLSASGIVEILLVRIDPENVTGEMPKFSDLFRLAPKWLFPNSVCGTQRPSFVEIKTRNPLPIRDRFMLTYTSITCGFTVGNLGAFSCVSALSVSHAIHVV